jgi:hypothetical protein
MIYSLNMSAGKSSAYGYWRLTLDFCLGLPVSLNNSQHCWGYANHCNCPVGGFLNLVSAAWINWFNAILFAVLLVLEVFFMPETLYPRQKVLLQANVVEGKPPLGADVEKQAIADKSSIHQAFSGGIPSEDLPRTKKLPFVNFVPVPGMRHPKPWDSITRFVLTFQFPVIVIGVLGYSFVWYWWILSVITMVPAAYVSYSPLIQGLLFLGLFLGTIISEICCSGRLSDYIVEKLAKQNGGVRVAEMRLWLAYPAILITAGEYFDKSLFAKSDRDIVGSILWGVSLDKNYHWMVGQVAFFLCKCGRIREKRVITANRLFSCCRDPDWEYGHQQLRRRLLSTAINKCDHVLRRVSELECLHQSGTLFIPSSTSCTERLR